MAARAICAALDGNPLDIILAAAHVRVYGVQLGELADGVRGAESSQEWLKGLIAGRSDRDWAALAAFAAVGCAPLETSESVPAPSPAPRQPQRWEGSARSPTRRIRRKA